MIANSFFVGLSFLGFGFLMYYLGQWGGGDAKILSAIGFLFPELPKGFSPSLILPFPLSFLFNLFFLGAIYMLFYSFILSIMNKTILLEFVKDLKASSNLLIAGVVSILAVFIGLNFYVSYSLQVERSLLQIVLGSIFPIVVTVALFLMWKFARSVETFGFKKKIPISKLRIGDVLMDSKVWEGITEKQLKKIKSSRIKSIWIKEGIRFIPAFPIALLFTLFLGDSFIFLTKLLI